MWLSSPDKNLKSLGSLASRSPPEGPAPSTAAITGEKKGISRNYFRQRVISADCVAPVPTAGTTCRLSGQGGRTSYAGVLGSRRPLRPGPLGVPPARPPEPRPGATRTSAPLRAAASASPPFSLASPPSLQPGSQVAVPGHGPER